MAKIRTFISKTGPWWLSTYWFRCKDAYSCFQLSITALSLINVQLKLWWMP